MMKYITKIRAKVSVYAKRRTSNVFDGSYKSIYIGNGFDFENLREYIPGDNVRDIDWKASSRGRKLLVKRYIAEKKHNIMLVFDTGKKMLAGTGGGQIKKDIALNVGGTFGYLTGRNGDDVGAIYNRNGMICYHQLKAGLDNVERILTEYDREDFTEYGSDLEKCLNYIIKNIKRRMIIFIISDEAGIKSVEDDTLKMLMLQHDVLFVSVGDADFTSGKSFDIEKAAYIPDFISGNKHLRELERQVKRQVTEDNVKKLIKHGIVSTKIDSEEEIVDKVIELLERHKYAGNR